MVRAVASFLAQIKLKISLDFNDFVYLNVFCLYCVLYLVFQMFVLIFDLRFR